MVIITVVGTAFGIGDLIMLLLLILGVVEVFKYLAIILWVIFAIAAVILLIVTIIAFKDADKTHRKIILFLFYGLVFGCFAFHIATLLGILSSEAFIALGFVNKLLNMLIFFVLGILCYVFGAVALSFSLDYSGDTLVGQTIAASILTLLSIAAAVGVVLIAYT